MNQGPLAPVPPAPGVTTPPFPDADAAPPPLGRIVVGLVLILAGLVWLLDAANVLDVSWGALLPVALIVVGLALVAGSGSGRHGGLVTLGVILTIVLSLASGLNVPLSGGVGERVERPATVVQIPDRYELTLGSLRIDLTAMNLLAETFVTARVGMGELVVTVPTGVSLEVRGRATAGQVQVLDQERNGVSVDHTFVVDQPGATARLTLDLAVGFGSIKVER